MPSRWRDAPSSGRTGCRASRGRGAAAPGADRTGRRLRPEECLRLRSSRQDLDYCCAAASRSSRTARRPPSSSVFGKEDKKFSMVLVPSDAPGVTVTPTPELIAPHVLGEIRVQRRDAARLGPGGHTGPGSGPRACDARRVSRVCCRRGHRPRAGRARGGRAPHTHCGVQFGRPLARLGPVAQMLADSWTEIEMARLLTYRAASLCHRRSGSIAAAFVDGQARRDGDGFAGGRSLRPGHGSVRPDSQLEDRAPLSAGSTDARSTRAPPR